MSAACDSPHFAPRCPLLRRLLALQRVHEYSALLRHATAPVDRQEERVDTASQPKPARLEVESGSGGRKAAVGQRTATAPQQSTSAESAERAESAEPSERAKLGCGGEDEEAAAAGRPGRGGDDQGPRVVRRPVVAEARCEDHRRQRPHGPHEQHGVSGGGGGGSRQQGVPPSRAVQPPARHEAALPRVVGMLEKVPLFADFPAAQHRSLARHFRLRTYGDGPRRRFKKNGSGLYI